MYYFKIFFTLIFNYSKIILYIFNYINQFRNLKNKNNYDISRYI